MSTENQNFRTAVIVATIGVIGTLGTAILTNWDKVFPKQTISLPTVPPTVPFTPIPPIIPPSQAPNSPVSSEVSTKLTSLKNLLADKKWVEADLATDVLRPAALSCSDLSSINKLWLEYSNNNFGYSVQRKIWQQRKLHNKYADFAEFVGWKHDNRYAFNIRDPLLITDPDAPTKAPLGHLPFNGWQVKGVIRDQFDAFMLKLAQCKV